MCVCECVCVCVCSCDRERVCVCGGEGRGGEGRVWVRVCMCEVGCVWGRGESVCMGLCVLTYHVSRQRTILQFYITLLDFFVLS